MRRNNLRSSKMSEKKKGLNPKVKPRKHPTQKDLIRHIALTKKAVQSFHPTPAQVAAVEMKDEMIQQKKADAVQTVANRGKEAEKMTEDGGHDDGR
jgi:hypothetical protein